MNRSIRTAAAASPQAGPLTAAELRRVSVAGAMLIVLGTLIVLVMMMFIGHYNSLVMAGPKAVLDGLVIALLLGRDQRWRCLALLGAAYGLVVTVQVGVVYLLPLLVMAGLLGAMAGKLLSFGPRWLAVVVAAVVYEWVAGCGFPIRILLGTRGDEPVLWAMWFAEWPVRLGGVIVGVCLTARLIDWARQHHDPPPVSPRVFGGGAVRTADRPPDELRRAGLTLLMAVMASWAPMLIDSLAMLVIVALLYAAWAWSMGLARDLPRVLVVMLGGYVVFSAASFIWHHDWLRVTDLARTFVLRFWPLTLAGLVLLRTVRPAVLVKLLRRLGVGGWLILPVAGMLRECQPLRRDLVRQLDEARRQARANQSRLGPRQLQPMIARLFRQHVTRWVLHLAG